MNELLTFNFWFNPRPEVLTNQGLMIALIIVAILFVLGILARYNFLITKWQPNRSLLRKISPILITNAIVLLYFWFLDSQVVPILRARAWFGFWLLIDIAWIIGIILSIKALLQRRKDRAQTSDIKKYIPS